MKNKKNIYFLIPAALLIWGLIGYRIVKTINPETPEVIIRKSISTFKPTKIEMETSYEIAADYRDPFLGSTKSKKVVKRRIVKPKDPIIFPNIVFTGVVSPKEKKNTQIFLVQINGSQNLLKLKDKIMDLTLVKGNNKEIVLEYKKERQTFPIRK